MQLDELKLKRWETLFLLGIYILGLYLRLTPRLEIDPHLLTFQGDIWYRLAMAQYVQDNGSLPEPDLRYRPYGYVPMWYPPISLFFFALTSSISGLDIPTVSSRLVPFLESLTSLGLYFLAKYLYGTQAAFISALALALTPSFIFWSGISDPQSLTLFLIPLVLLAWLKHAKAPSSKLLIGLGVLLGFNFLTHLSYFITALSLLMATIALIIRREAGKRLLADYGKVILISQLVAAPWWLPRNLYWWWIKALVTSSGLYPAAHQLAEYGTIAALIGIASYLFLLKDGKRHLLVLLWALPLLLETQNEVILKALNASHLSWSTLAKPLEGFRFYPFAAQPLAVAIGASIAGRRVTPLLALILFSAMAWGIYDYGLGARFQNSGITTAEYEAALWFRANSAPDDRIIADYYRVQMFIGVSGGKALEGGVFPLRNVDYPYIKAPGQVQNDLYILYKTPNPSVTRDIARRYNATHIFYSDNMRRYGNLLSYYKPASEYGVDIYYEKFEDGRYFEKVYGKDSPHGAVVIFRVKK